uniref:Uncharacterized protein n=1 Tax=Triticum urartu TaxID=4572 RepID=A0A8R7UNC8_TRIUA
MAGSEGHELVAVLELQGEALGRETIGGLQCGYEVEAARTHVEEADEGRVAAVAAAEPTDESWVGDEAAPLTADEGGAREGGGLWGEAEEDLGEQILVFQRRRRRR